MTIIAPQIWHASHIWLAPHVWLAQGGGDWFVPILLVLLIFYFIVMRPASKERKAREAQLSALKKHDRVVTNAGIHGTVVALEDDAVVLRVDDKNNVRIRFSRTAIWQVMAASEERKEKEKDAKEEAEESAS